MGDFERTFGAGADVESIIDNFDRSWRAEQREARREAQNSQQGGQTMYDRAVGEEMLFPSVDAAEDWMKAHPGVQYVGRRHENGWAMKILSRP